jgi:ankyrin repeat protein
LSLGIDVNTQNSAGSTALMAAVIHGQYEIVEQLLQVKDIDVNLTENDGWTPLFFAANYNFPFIVKLLMENGANKYYISPAGFHAYFLATNFPEVIQMLNSFP